MAEITASLVKELRERTGAGMMDCKKALTEADGSMEKAVELLREKGLAASAKKAGRIASEGMVAVYLSDDNKIGAIVEVNSETDFVAKNQVFRDYVAAVAKQASETTAADMDAFFEEKWALDPQFTVKEALSQQVAVIGENLNIRRFEKYEKTQAGKLVSYIHGGGRIGVLIELACENEAEELVELGKNIAMQIAALNTPYLKESDVPAEVLEHEKEIMKAEVVNSGKPEAIADKIVMGKIGKFYKENCLLDQAFVKENKISVQQYTNNTAKELGGSIEITEFVRFEKGEGIEKREDDFAAEVAAMTK